MSFSGDHLSTDTEPPSERERILRSAGELFLEMGYRKVTMDDVAAELGMSKKTLYQHFPGKRELFRQTLLSHVYRIRRGLEVLVSDPEVDFHDKLRNVLLFMAKNLPRPRQPFFRDLQTEVRDVWEEIDRERLETIQMQFGKLFQQGLHGGHVREDIDISLLILMISTLIQKLLSPSVMASLPLTASEVFEQIVKILSFGVVSLESGRNSGSADSL